MSRYYDVDKLKYPSVTTIIGDCTDKSGPLMGWVAKCYRQYMEDAIVDYEDAEQSAIPFGTLRALLDAGKQEYRNVSKEALDIGSEVHAWIETYLKSKCYPDIDYGFYYNLKPEVHNAVSAFLDWAWDNDLKPAAVEETVYGDGWAGTLDYVGLYNGKLYVIDWKSSKAIYPEMRYQIAAYRSECWVSGNDCGKGFGHRADIEGCGILRLDKETGMPEFKDTSKSYEQDLVIFNNMVELYFSRHPIIAKKAGR